MPEAVMDGRKCREARIPFSKEDQSIRRAFAIVYKAWRWLCWPCSTERMEEKRAGKEGATRKRQGVARGRIRFGQEGPKDEVLQVIRSRM